MKALLIDPSKTYQHVLGLQFREAGFDTSGYTTGQEALANFDPHQFDLVCVSLHLGDMSGIDFCEALRERVGRQVPVIMVTSDEQDAVQISGMKSGITDIFNKSNLVGLRRFLDQFVHHLRIARELVGNVLYIEDSRSAAFVVQKYLNEMGLTVDYFPQARPALEAFMAKEYDLVLTDVILEGGMSGLGLTREIRQLDGVRQRVPILAMSGVEDVARKIELLRSGVNDYIAKPVIAEELAARVRSLIDNKKLMDKVEEQQKRLEELAMTDQLTGLLNRRYLDEVIERRVSEALRQQFPLSLIVMDIDHFKVVNDTHGHAVGDAVLVDAARLLRGSCRREDVALRYGGEEFLLVMSFCRGEDAAKRADSLRLALEGIYPGGIPVTASFGVTELPKGRQVSFEELFRCADSALYKAKNSGRNRVVFQSMEPIASTVKTAG